jgi:S-adenosylmethionine:tRNA ribosyltransferase-isomerase
VKRQDFFFELPENLIAQQPAAQRRDSRLLVMSDNQSDYRLYGSKYSIKSFFSFQKPKPL